MNEITEIEQAIQNSFNEYFPNAWSFINVRNSFGKEHISINFGLVDKSELTSRILENDPVFHTFVIHNEGAGKYEAVNVQSGIKINPVNPMYAMDRVKTKFRKTTGDSKRIIRTFDTFFKRLKVLVNEHESNIYQRKGYSDKYLKL